MEILFQLLDDIVSHFKDLFLFVYVLATAIANATFHYFLNRLTTLTDFVDNKVDAVIGACAKLPPYTRAALVVGFPLVTAFFGGWNWVIWALILLAQNFSFTYVSRARNSGSVSRHIKAAVFSNGIWFASQYIVFSKFMQYMSGAGGWPMLVFAGLFYTYHTITGSVLAHYHALRSEKGQSAVGANKKYAQFSAEEGEQLRTILESFRSIKETDMRLDCGPMTAIYPPAMPSQFEGGKESK